MTFIPDSSAVCSQVDASLFFPHKGDDTNAGRNLCNTCPLINPCLDWALHNGVAGVWGGTNETQRRRIRKQLGIVAEPFPKTPLSYSRDAVRLRKERDAA